MSDDKCLLSVIVPVYNVEAYIEECVESLFGQDLKERIEFIFVDDASTDWSRKALTDVIARHPDREVQTKIIDNPLNIGLVATRKKGLEASTGEYVVFCDSDDWVDRGLYAGMLRMAEEDDAEIVGCDMIFEYELKRSLHPQEYDVTERQIVEMLKGNPRYAGSLCTRMIRREFLLNNRPDIPDSLTMMEDLAISLPLHMIATRVAKYTGNDYYHYRQRCDSMTASISQTYVASMLNGAAFIKSVVAPFASTYSMKEALALFLLKAKLPYIYNIEVYNPEAWRQTFPKTPLHRDIGWLPYISCWLEQWGLSLVNRWMIRLRKYARKR